MGLLGYEDLSNLEYAEINPKFSGSLNEDTFQRVMEEFSRQSLYQQMLHVGLKLREREPLFTEIDHLTWSGPDRQAVTTSAAKDIFAANTPVSVKAESRVVGNPSPYNLFVATPQGSAQARGMGSWYLEISPDKYQALYSHGLMITELNSGRNALPPTVQEFENSRKKKVLKRKLSNLSSNQLELFQSLYIDMCRQVATRSARRYNDHLAASLSQRVRNTVLERVAKMFFRMNAVPYVLAGIDNQQEFAVRIPDLTSWLKNWRFETIEATPDLNRSQSVVNFELCCTNKQTGLTYSAEFHAEVRWSHGKFSSVEGKLYKEFDWADLPFFESLLE